MDRPAQLVTDAPSTPPAAAARPARAPTPDRSPTTRFYDLVEARFRRLVRDNPVLGTCARPARTTTTCSATAAATRVLGELDDERAHLAAVEAIDPAELSPGGPLRARPRAPQRPPGDLRHRRACDSGSGARSRSTRRRRPVPAVRARPRAARRTARRHRRPARGRRHLPRGVQDPGQRSRRSAAGSSSRSRPPRELPAFFDEIVAAGRTASWPPAEQRRLERAADAAKVAVELYADWLEGTLADGTDDWAIGRERHDALVGLRAFDGLDARRDPGARLGAAGRGEGRRASRRRARSTPTPTRRPSSTGSSATSRPTSRPPSTPTATRCCAPAGTSSSTTW